MNRSALILLLSCLVSLLSCQIENVEVPSYVENKTSFFDLRHGDWTINSWIRQPKNLLIVHNSFKRYGYQKLLEQFIDDDDFFILGNVYIKKNFYQLADSLEISFHSIDSSHKYYQEFWQRRKLEGNDSIVYKIVQDFNDIRRSQSPVSIDRQASNDTLVRLLEIEFDNLDIDQKKAIQNFNDLRKFGLHQSAYNLLFERAEYSHLDLDRDEMKLKLQKSDSIIFPWLIDTEK